MPGMPGSCASLEHGGEALLLLPERAVWWEAERTLLVSDAHLGREIGLRRLGVPVPRGASLGTALRLADCGRRLGARRLVVLGDLFHSRESRESALEEEVGRLLGRVFGERWLVRGNHDLGAGDPAAAWEFRICEPGTSLGPFDLYHAPPDSPRRPALAGHLHPVLRLRGPARLRLRLPVFWLRRGVLILPSFGEFTGGMEAARDRCCRYWVCGEGEVSEVRVGGVSARGAARSRRPHNGSTSSAKARKLPPP